MADDLEAFLRQAAQRRAQRQAGALRPAAPAPTPAPPPPPAAGPAPASPQRPARGPLVPPPVRPTPLTNVVKSQVVTLAESPRLGTRVNTAGFEQRAEHLGEDVSLADEHMEAHIAEKFDHHVGSLSGGDTAQSDAGGADAALGVAELAALLKDPKTVRQAVILSEILNPPHFRR
jgi:hypothetical protein